MDKEQWIEIFTEINDRVPTEEEIQAGFQEGEITESEKIDNSFESTQFDSQTRSDEDLSQRVEDVQDKQEFSNDYTFCSSCGAKNSVNDERCMNCKKASKQTNDNVLYSTFKNNSLFRYLKHCFDTQRWGIIINQLSWTRWSNICIIYSIFIIKYRSIINLLDYWSEEDRKK